MDCNLFSSSLYSIVYGESMLNDVIGYTSFQTLLDIHLQPETRSILAIFSTLFWIFISIVLGYSIGLATALLCKLLSTDDANESERADNAAAVVDPRSSQAVDLENHLYSTDFAVMFLSPWIAYLIAEAFDLSAILTIFFCGLSLGHYAIHNLSAECRQVIYS